MKAMFCLLNVGTITDLRIVDKNLVIAAIVTASTLAPDELPHTHTQSRDKIPI